MTLPFIGAVTMTPAAARHHSADSVADPARQGALDLTIFVSCYNEQDFIKSLLPRYAVEFSSHWVVSRRPDVLQRGVLGRLPLVTGALESSLWLRTP